MELGCCKPQDSSFHQFVCDLTLVFVFDIDSLEEVKIQGVTYKTLSFKSESSKWKYSSRFAVDDSGAVTLPEALYQDFQVKSGYNLVGERKTTRLGVKLKRYGVEGELVSTLDFFAYLCLISFRLVFPVIAASSEAPLIATLAFIAILGREATKLTHLFFFLLSGLFRLGLWYAPSAQGEVIGTEQIYYDHKSANLIVGTFDPRIPSGFAFSRNICDQGISRLVQTSAVQNVGVYSPEDFEELLSKAEHHVAPY